MKITRTYGTSEAEGQALRVEAPEHPQAEDPVADQWDVAHHVAEGAAYQD